MAFTALTATSENKLKFEGKEVHALSETIDKGSPTQSVSLTFGTGDGKANLVWHDQVAPGTLTLNSLSRSVLGVGGDYDIDKLKALYATNSSTTDGTITISAMGISSMSIPAKSSFAIQSPTGWSFSTTQTIVIGGATMDIVLVGEGTSES